MAFAPDQVETAELLSKMTGTRTVQKASCNFSGSRFSPVMGHVMPLSNDQTVGLAEIYQQTSVRFLCMLIPSSPPRSFESRYFGQIPASLVRPILTVWGNE